MILPSKDLLSEVLEFEVRDVKHHGTSILHLNPSQRRDKPSSCVVSKQYNIYELMHLMKEWADDLYDNYKLISYRNNLKIWICEDISGQTDTIFEADTEFEAVTKACELVLVHSKG